MQGTWMTFRILDNTWIVFLVLSMTELNDVIPVGQDYDMDIVSDEEMDIDDN